MAASQGYIRSVKKSKMDIDRTVTFALTKKQN